MKKPCLGRPPVLPLLHPQHLSSSSLVPCPLQWAGCYHSCLLGLHPWTMGSTSNGLCQQGRTNTTFVAAGFFCLQFLWFPGMFKWWNQAITTSVKECLKADTLLNNSLLNTHPHNVKQGGGGKRREWGDWEGNLETKQTTKNPPKQANQQKN